MMTSDQIRERFLAFFEERGHRRLASASLVPPPEDRSVLLTTAGMQPLKPYFLGREKPPAPTLTSCQMCFRTPDIEKVGSTLRHLTCFEMLGNFSIGAYFKQGAIELAWELSLEVFGFSPEDIWVTVFAGDPDLGLGADEEAIELWQAVGVPRERIVGCPRSENFWEAGPVGPSGPCSELYLDRGLAFGAAEDLPGGENERFLEFWNLVFMQYNQDPHDVLTELPMRNIDTGLGLNRMAAILQGKSSVFETDQFQPLLDLGQELSGQRYGDRSGEILASGSHLPSGQHATDRALRILADHARGMSFMVADGVVPSNEERGYVLRRVMRRAIQQGRGLGMEGGFLVRYAALVRELMGSAYPELSTQRAAIEKWLASEEESFGRTLEQGTRLLEELIQRALDAGEEGIAAADAFALHDTYGFPFDLTRELVAERGLGVDPEGFERLMEAQRARARAAAGAERTAGEDPREHARELAAAAGFQTRFTGYETELQRTTVGALAPISANDSAEGVPGNDSSANGAPGNDSSARGEPAGEQAAAGAGRYLLKLAESPFYPAGGGQISDVGVIECESGDCRARVEGVFRLGDDQALAVVFEQGTLDPDEPVLARVDHAARHATECNHTATHLLHAALRARLGDHVRQAGSYVGPDKLRFDFSHSQALSPEELRDVEDQVNAWILVNDPVSPITTTLEEARRLGAMALFGEKYGEVVRMVQIGDGADGRGDPYSRELCGGTHVRSTAEIGLFRIQSETSSAANVRRIEALTGPAAVELMRAHDRWLAEIATTLRTRPEGAPEAVRERELERRRLEKERKQQLGASAASAADGESRLAVGWDLDALAAQTEEVAGARVLSALIDVPDPKALPDLVDRLKGRLPDAAIVLGGALDGRVHLIVGVAPALVGRGVKAGAIVKAAAAVVGGGGGGRDTLAQAGGRDVEKLQEALGAGRAAIEAALAEGARGLMH
jgi:alanyl-tRNA synthetase